MLSSVTRHINLGQKSLKMPKYIYQPVLPDRSLLIGQKLFKNAKIQMSNSVTRQVNFYLDKNWCKMPKLKKMEFSFFKLFSGKLRHMWKTVLPDVSFLWDKNCWKIVMWHYEWRKVNKNAKKGQFLAIFWKPCGKTVLPDR